MQAVIGRAGFSVDAGGAEVLSAALSCRAPRQVPGERAYSHLPATLKF